MTRPSPAPTTFPVWIEGYAATGNRAVAEFKGNWPGTTFADACRAWVKSLPPNERRFFDSAQLTFWGCRLTQTEAEARATFG